MPQGRAVSVFAGHASQLKDFRRRATELVGTGSHPGQLVLEELRCRFIMACRPPTAITPTVTAAAGRFAPGHLCEPTAVVPFELVELVDAVLAETARPHEPRNGLKPCDLRTCMHRRRTDVLRPVNRAKSADWLTGAGCVR